jgi:ABC-2 type transport system permease protein
MKSMKLMVFEGIKKRVKLIRLSLEHNFRIDTAYWFENISSLFFVMLYSILMLVFNEVIFTTTDQIGPYDKNMMRAFLSLSSLNFFIFGYILIPSIMLMIRDINTGQFDYNLIRPVPSLFYTLTKRIQWFTLVRDGLTQSFLIALFVDWGDLVLTLKSIIFAFLIWLIGQYLTQFVIFMFAATAFKTGESSAMVDIVWALDYRLNRNIPFDPLPTVMKAGFMFIIPILYTTGITMSVLLGLSNPEMMFFAALTTAFVAFLIQQFVWRRALANYTSASS